MIFKEKEVSKKRSKVEGNDVVDFDYEAILVADDDKELNDAICASLAEDLHSVRFLQAFDGNQALDVFEKEKPGVIILNLMMPKRSGFLVLESIKKKGSISARTPPIVIIITGSVGSRHRVWAESLGAWKYMQKPFRMERLFENVQEALQIARPAS